MQNPPQLTSSFFFFGLLSSPLSSVSDSALRLLPSDFSLSCAVFWDCRNSAIRSGQSRFSSGSQVLSSLQAKVTVEFYTHVTHTGGFAAAFPAEKRPGQRVRRWGRSSGLDV